MRIDMLRGIDGAGNARGAAVVVDVFRAFTLAPCAFARGAERIVPVADVAEARRLRADHPEWRLVAERGGRPVAGADFGNSPAAILAADLAGRTLIHTTSAGTRGLAAAAGAEIVLTGAFVNATAVVDCLRRLNPDRVSLVAMGSAGVAPSPEDTACVGYLRDRLLGRATDFPALARRLRRTEEARKFGDPDRPWFPAADLEVCLDLDRFDRALLLERNPTGMTLRPAELPDRASRR